MGWHQDSSSSHVHLTIFSALFLAQPRRSAASDDLCVRAVREGEKSEERVLPSPVGVVGVLGLRKVPRLLRPNFCTE